MMYGNYNRQQYRPPGGVSPYSMNASQGSYADYYNGNRSNKLAGNISSGGSSGSGVNNYQDTLGQGSGYSGSGYPGYSDPGRGYENLSPWFEQNSGDPYMSPAALDLANMRKRKKKLSYGEPGYAPPGQYAGEGGGQRNVVPWKPKDPYEGINPPDPGPPLVPYGELSTGYTLPGGQYANF